MDVVTGRWAKPMIKKAKQYSAHHTDRFWLKVAYLMLVLGVGILAVSAITNPDSYPFRRTGPVVEGEGVDATAEYEDVGLLLEEGNSQEAYGTAPLAEPEGTAQGWNLQGYDAAAGAPASPTSPMAGPFIMPQGADFVEELKMDRDKTRSREEEVLQRLIDDANTHPDVCRRAQEALLSLAERARREAEAESMIQAQGYERAVVFLSEAGASVVVKSGRLEEAEVWRIGNVVSVATGVELRNISIMESLVKDNSGMR